CRAYAGDVPVAQKPRAEPSDIRQGTWRMSAASPMLSANERRRSGSVSRRQPVPASLKILPFPAWCLLPVLRTTMAWARTFGSEGLSDEASDGKAASVAETLAARPARPPGRRDDAAAD